jgi:hypothetical protein
MKLMPYVSTFSVTVLKKKFEQDREDVLNGTIQELPW